MDIKSIIKSNIKNIPGKRIRRKFVVIECDDWGSIRMPSKDTSKELSEKGVELLSSRYDYDTLANVEDLEVLFECLTSFRDSNKNHPVLTAVANMGNPDFEKIKQSDFSKYFSEPFDVTLKRYYNNDKVFDFWQQGIDNKLFMPELHGREHLSVQLWLEQLKKGDKQLLTAFDHGFVSLELKYLPEVVRGFRPEFYFEAEGQKQFLRKAFSDGVKTFKELFGYQPNVFVPTNLIFHPYFEPDVEDAGIKYLYVNRSMMIPDGLGGLEPKKYNLGAKKHSSLHYYTRNCVFEPTDSDYKGIGYTMMQIEAAFRWGKPAIISTHRTNFVGGINVKNREKGIRELTLLLKEIVKRWPDIEFVRSVTALDNYYSY